MRITGTIRADLTSLKLSYREDDDTRTVTVGLSLGLSEDAMRVLLGDEFAASVFSHLNGDTWDFRGKIRPNVVCELHNLTIVGQRLAAIQPVLYAIRPDGAGVIVELRLPIEIRKQGLIGALGSCYGSMVELALEPMMDELPLTDPAVPALAEDPEARDRSGEVPF